MCIASEHNREMKRLQGESKKLDAQIREKELITALLACEIGYKACEAGNNLETALMKIRRIVSDT